MKSELKAKFVQHLISKKKGNEGFTLIELLVVIVIIGILAAIALPSFLSQANKARESEGRNFAGTLLRSQQAHYLEKQAFTKTLADLETGDTKADFYTFCAETTATSVTVKAKAKSTELHDFQGGVTVAANIFDVTGPDKQATKGTIAACP